MSLFRQKKKLCEFTVTCWKKLGSVGQHFYFYFFLKKYFVRIHEESTLEHISTTHVLELLLYCHNNKPIHVESITWKQKCDI